MNLLQLHLFLLCTLHLVLVSNLKVQVGNPLSSSRRTLASVQDVAFVLTDFDLVPGLIREFRMYIEVDNDPPSPVRIQVWRPAGGATLTLVSDVEFIPSESGIYRIYPGPDVRVQAGDKIGFLSRGNDSAVVYDFMPQHAGTELLAKSFQGIPGAPATGYNYTFDGLSYDTWRFCISAMVDTDYIGGPLPGSGIIDKDKPDVTIDANRTVSENPPVIRQVRGRPNEESSDLLWLAIVLPLIYVLITVTASVYAIYHVFKRNRRVILTPYDNPIPVKTEGEWSIQRKNICIHEKLSEGPAGTIYKAEVCGLIGQMSWATVAVKVLPETASDEQKTITLAEITAMKILRPHINILQLLGYCLDKDQPIMIVEAVPCGNLLDYLRELKETNLNMNIAGHNNFTLTKDLIGFCAQIAKAMAYISTMRMLHRHLCARHILLAEGRICKVSDFGLIQDIIEHHEYQRAIQSPQPIRWMAPESLSCNLFTSKSDVYAFGVLLWEVITLGATPYADMDSTRVERHVKKGGRLERPPHCKPELFALAGQCWYSKPQERPTFERLSHHLEALRDMNTDLLQLEKYPDSYYFVLEGVASNQEIL